MSSSEYWIIVIAAIVVAGVVGFLLGRKQSPAEAEIKRLTEHHQQQLLQKQAEMDAFREEMHEHYDKTASLFVSMAGSYRELYDHLSEGYEKLGDLGVQKKLPERPGALLDGPEYDEGHADQTFPGDSTHISPVNKGPVKDD
jgi:uncharacterized membrane-anchored protein YhcB (DUF1043 family)